ncbi:MAG: alpha-galactosidase, partial [Maribacter sp.]|nr:alpha-galactosidase [Maribacter sp.]
MILKIKIRTLAFLMAFGISSALSMAQKSGDLKDWLIDNSNYTSLVIQKGNDISLYNGLVNRTIRIAPNAATIEFKNLTTGESMLRSIKPEAEVSINGKAYAVGG